MSDITLRSNLAKVIDVYGTIIGAVPLQLLFYHVNNENKFEKTGFSEEEAYKECAIFNKLDVAFDLNIQLAREVEVL